jgi:hypothetical protein
LQFDFDDQFGFWNGLAGKNTTGLKTFPAERIAKGRNRIDLARNQICPAGSVSADSAIMRTRRSYIQRLFKYGFVERNHKLQSRRIDRNLLWFRLSE